MKFNTLIKLTFAVNVIAAGLLHTSTAQASTFEEQELAQEQVIAIASPYRHGYNLVIIEQIPGQQQCWAEEATSSVGVNPLLMNFDFTGHCRRATDSNGYSVRIDGEEKGTDYLLNIVEHNGSLVLQGTARDPNVTPLTIGQTHGKSAGATKIFLNPGWRFTKRSYQGQELGHFYFSKTSAAATTTVQEVSFHPERSQ